jgi:formyltetrahydrofolate deformylase
MTTRHILTLACPDRPGLVHAVSAGLLDVGGNIVENAQFSEPETGMFCLRTVVDTESGEPDDVRTAVIARLVAAGAETSEATTLNVRRGADRHRMMIVVSRADHCLVDLLYRWQTGALPVEIPLIVSNHPDLAHHAEHYGIEFRHLPVTPDAKAAQEAALRALLAEHSIDLVVLARYMQILSDELCRQLAGRVINIHHSFLPGFKGARPYHQAYHRGVKLVGATAHFVTPDLDEGPIIEQDVARVDHAHTVDELTRLGQDTERLVLARAVRMWSEDRIVLVGNKTVVFR